MSVGAASTADGRGTKCCSECPLWVSSGHVHPNLECPQKCHKRTFAPLDSITGATAQVWRRNREPAAAISADCGSGVAQEAPNRGPSCRLGE